MKALHLVFVCSSLVLTQRETIGQRILVSGIDTDTPKSQVLSMRLEQQILSLETSAGQVKITGFPTWLNQNLMGTTLTSFYRLRPDGPETRLEWTRGKTPFLLLGSSTSPNSVLLGNWRFLNRITDRTAFIELFGKNKALLLGRAVLLKQGLLLWCVRLAALHLPAADEPNIANEAEGPRFDWAALRVAKVTDCQN
jgi:hypothetical protein